MTLCFNYVWFKKDLTWDTKLKDGEMEVYLYFFINNMEGI